MSKYSNKISSLEVQDFREKYELKALKYTDLLIQGKVIEGKGRGISLTSRAFLGSEAYKTRCIYLANLWDVYNSIDNN